MDPTQLMDLDDMAILEEISAEYGLPPAAPPALANLGSQPSLTSGVPPPSAFGVAPAGLPPGVFPSGGPLGGAADALPPFAMAPPPGALPPFSLGHASSAASASSRASAATAVPPAGDAMSVIDEALNLLAYDAAQVGPAGARAAALGAGCPPRCARSACGTWRRLRSLLRQRGPALPALHCPAPTRPLPCCNPASPAPTCARPRQVTYIPEDKLFRFSAKLFNCTPDQLPTDLKASLINMLTCNSLEGYIRPGCVHVTVDALMGPEEREAMATEVGAAGTAGAACRAGGRAPGGPARGAV